MKNVILEEFFINLAMMDTHFGYKKIPRIADLGEQFGINWFIAYKFILTGLEKFIIEKDLSLHKQRKPLKGSCGKCGYRYYCGGCRARAFNYFGDYTAPDPGCIYNKKYNKEFLDELNRISI